MANTMHTQDPSTPRPKQHHTSRTGPEAKAVIKYLRSHTDQALSIGEVAAATNVSTTVVSSMLRHQAKLTAAGASPAVHIWQPLTGMIKRVRQGVYYVDTKGTQPTPDQAATDVPTAGMLMEVIKAWDTGRTIMVCEQGHVYHGTLHRVAEA